jgi:hypothetical protein
MGRIIANQDGRTINPVQVTISIIGVVLAFICGALSRRIESDGIQNVLILFLKTILALTLLVITVMILYYFYKFLFNAIYWRFHRRKAIRVFREHPSGIDRICRRSGNTIEFAASDKIENRREIIEEFWRDILGTDYRTSFVSNESTLDSWEHYVPGGRENVIQKVKNRFGVDISGYYDEPIIKVLDHIESHRTQNLQDPAPP